MKKIISILGMLLLPITVGLMLIGAEISSRIGDPWVADRQVLAMIALTLLAGMVASLLSIPFLWRAIQRWRKDPVVRTTGYTVCIGTSLLCNIAMAAFIGYLTFATG